MRLEASEFQLAIVKVVELERARNVAGLIQLLGSDLTSRRGTHPIRGQAARALSRIGDPAVATHVVPLTSDPLEDVRFDAVIALGRLGDRACCGVLLHALGDESEVVRMAAGDGLGTLRCADARAALLAMLDEHDWGFRVTAAEALCKLPAGTDTVEGIEAALSRQRFWNRGQRRLGRALRQARAAEARRTSGWGSM